jgi:ferredoxin-thioredoxin reductase catalytic chain
MMRLVPLLGWLLLLLLESTAAFLPRHTAHHQPVLARTTTTTSLNAADLTPEEREVAMEKATKAMTAFTNTYLKNTGTTLCADKSVPAVVIKGLAEHKVNLGSPLCPCRFYDDKEAEAKDGYWNCPCVPMRERHECHCMLFLTDDNPFAGEEQTITVDEVVKGSSGLEM